MSHSHNREGRRVGGSTRKLITASCICFAFMVFEILAGLYAGSLAIVTDAAHMLSDLCSFGISLVAIYLSYLPPTAQLSFGYQRVEMLGAFLSIMIIWILTFWLVVEAFGRMWNPTPVKAGIMIITGLFGLSSNVVIALVLSGSSDHHHHHHARHHHDILPNAHESENYLVENLDSPSQSSSDLSSVAALQGNAVEGYKRAGDVIKRLSQHSAVGPCSGGELENVASAYVEIKEHDEMTVPEMCSSNGNVNVWAAYLHTLGDMIQNVGVIAAGTVIYWRPNWTIADPICTIFFALIVVYTTFGLIQEALMLLMEGTPQGISSEKVARALRQIPEVK